MEPTLGDLHMLMTLAEVTNSDLDLEHVLQAVTDAGTRLTGAQFGAFFYTGGGTGGSHYRFHVLSGADADMFAKMPAPRITPLFEPTFAGQGPTRIDDVTTDTRVTGLPRGHLPLRSYLATPVQARSGEVIGALLFGHPDAAVFDDRSEDIVRVVAAQAAVAAESARLFTAEQEARRQAEESLERLGLLQTITARLAAAFTPADALSAVMDTVVGPLHADRVGVYLADGDLYRAVAGVRNDPGPAETQVRVLPASLRSPVSVAADTRAPVLLESSAALADQFPQIAEAIAAGSVGAAIALPIIFGDTVLGALVLTWTGPRTFPDAEVEMLTAAAGQLASALERARLYEAERAAQEKIQEIAEEAIRVSRTLQRSLLPPPPPQVGPVSVAVRYVPGTEGAEVGGDWYDVIDGPDGRVTFVVGDVQGHSLGAAAVMGQVRTVLHAYLAEGHDPHVAVARVNQVMDTMDVELLATCCVVSLDPVSGRAVVVRAGHPLPLLRKMAGPVTEIDCAGGLPLGVLPDAQWPTTTVALDAGDRLVLYTDGLVEDPAGTLSSGVCALLATTAGIGGADIEAAADAIVASASDRHRDDVALLVCDYAGPAGSAERVAIDVADVVEVGRARQLARDTLRQWDLTDLEDTLTLLVSEMVTNALVHTDGSATLELRRDTDRVRVLVTDEHSRVPRPQEENFEATGGRGMMLVEALAEDWGVEPVGEGKTVWADISR